MSAHTGRMATESVRLSPLAKDYLEFRKDLGETTSFDATIREVFDEADSDWREKAREWRETDI